MVAICTKCCNIYPSNAELNAICLLLTLGVHHILHISRLRVKLLLTLATQEISVSAWFLY